MEAQKKIREQQSALQEHLQALYSWEAEIKQKDAEIKEKVKAGKITEKQIPSIRHTVTIPSSISAPSATTKSTSTEKNASEDKITQALAEKDKGNELFNKGKYAEAIEYYSKAIKLDPTNPIFPANRALAHLKQKNFAAAESDSAVSITIDPLYVKAYLRRGVARQGLGRLEEAIKDFEHALKLESSNKQATEELAKSKVLLAERNKAQPTSNKSAQTTQQATQQTNQPKTTSEVRAAASGMKKIAIKEVDDELPFITPAAVNTNKPTSTTSTIPSAAPSPTETTSTSTNTNGNMDTNTKTSINTNASTNTTTSSTTNSTNTSANESTDTNSATKKSSPPAQKRTPKETLSTIASRIVPTLPLAPPKTSFEFEREWHSISGHPELMYQYILMIPPTGIPSIFKDTMSSSVLSSFIDAISNLIKEGKFELGIQILSNLHKIGRFDILLMFAGSKEKQTLREIFENLQQTSQVDVETVTTLRTKFST